MEQTARFWHPYRDGWVKLTVRGDKVLHFGYGGPNEEGWSSSSETLWLDDGAVMRRCVDDGRDCDGRLTRIWAGKCLVEKLASRECGLEDAPGLLPDWQEVSSRQRDEYAEAMGY